MKYRKLCDSGGTDPRSEAPPGTVTGTRGEGGGDVTAARYPPLSAVLTHPQLQHGCFWERGYTAGS